MRSPDPQIEPVRASRSPDCSSCRFAIFRPSSERRNERGRLGSSDFDHRDRHGAFLDRAIPSLRSVAPGDRGAAPAIYVLARGATGRRHFVKSGVRVGGGVAAMADVAYSQSDTNIAALA
jgi:hypothetical protein